MDLRILTIYLFSLFSIVAPKFASAQVSDDFESGALNGWYSEGDGDFSISSAQGNPGNSFVVDDDATGNINYAIAPAQYLGDWTSAVSGDSLVLDVFVESNDTDTLVGMFPMFELVGPGGRATALEGLDLPNNTWSRVGVPLDPSSWTIVSGTWGDLIANVSLVRVRAEFITGNENVYLDNVRLDIDIVRLGIRDTVCSDFEDGTVDGWRFEETGSFDVDSVSGNPGLGVSVGDRGGEISQTIAPPKFLGDWSLLADSGQLQFDLWIDNSSGGLYEKDYLVRLSGNSAVATILPPDSVLLLAVGQWHTFSFLIDSSKWTLESGNWQDLLLDIDEVRLELEFIDGGEIARLDNFCLVPKEVLSTSLPHPINQEAWTVAPNPANNQVRLLWEGKRTDASADLRVIDVQGRTIHQQPVSAETVLSVNDWTPGLYWLILTDSRTRQRQSLRLIVE